MAWCENQVDLFRLIVAVMSNRVPFKNVPAYLFGNTPDNEMSLLEGGLALYKAGIARPLVLCGGSPYIPPNSPAGAPPAYSGGDLWREWLMAHGVPETDIVFMDSPRPRLSHTGTDAERFVIFAKSRGWRTVIIVACPQHLLRAFAITVRCLEREYPELLAYSQPGASLTWDESCSLAQGVACQTRLREGMDLEWDRLNRVYGNPYDPVSAEEVIAYIERRDAAARRLQSA